MSATSPATGTEDCSKGNPAPLISFDDPSFAYKKLTSWEIVRALMVFRICSTPFLVKHSEQLLKLSTQFLGPTLTYGVVRHTLFKHFCAGEDEISMKPTIDKLTTMKVGAILDYAAEKDVCPEETKDQKHVEIVDRNDVIEVSGAIHDYVGEEECDRNMELVLDCIQNASNGKDGIAAIKLTGLGKPELLKRVSDILLGTRKMWIHAFSAKPMHKIPDQELRFAVSKPEYLPLVDLPRFRESVAKLNLDLTDEEVAALFDYLDIDNTGKIDYLEWTARLTLKELSEVPKPGAQCLQKLVRALAADCNLSLLTGLELQLIYNLQNRVRKIAQAASDANVRLLVDAEQTHLQVAIDHFTTQLQRQFNIEFPVIFNTYQCYLTFAECRVLNDLMRAEREGWIFAGKLVRGAYMVQERRLAEEGQYTSPIMETIEATHKNYNQCVQHVLNGDMSKREIMLATHNQASIEMAVETMSQRGLNPGEAGVFFGQLLGMADNLSLTLGAAGYRVYKYVPYGPIHEVMPYLIRRAQENGDIMAGAQKERVMLWQELMQRMVPFGTKSVKA